MKLIREPSQLRTPLLKARRQGKRVGFVPTMGNLHDGHLSLMRAARQDCDVVVASIFVNPLQFGTGEDLDNYPRTPEEDHASLQQSGVDIVFEPSEQTIYPVSMEQHTGVEVPGLSDQLCGASRPGHFRGVATIVAKLLNLVQPDAAYFGEKDFQQLAIIRRMCRDLCFPVEIIGMPTIREASGLAMSSRNNYLSNDQREQAAQLHETLQWAATALQEQSLPLAAIEQTAGDRLRSAGFIPDYVAIRNAEDLSPADGACDYLVILAAAQLGRTRLIDNLQLTLDDR